MEEKVNSHGFRGPDFTDKKPPGVKRVTFLGDSNTFGTGVEGDEYYVHRIARWLQTSKDTKWEVMNTAAPGYSSFQMLKMLETRVSRYEPDIVVIYAGAWNDFTPAVGEDDERAYGRIQQFSGRAKSILHKLELFERMGAFFNNSSEDAGAGSKPTKRELYRNLWSERAERPDGPRLEKESFRKILTKIAEWCKSRGAKIIFVTPPAPFETRARFKDGETYSQILSNVASARADAVADARAALFSESGEQDKILFNDFIHPSPAGHGRVARVVARSIASLNIPGVPPAEAEMFTNDPIDLKILQKNAENYLGEPLAPVDGAILYNHGEPEHVVTAPSPYKLIYKSVTLPPNPSLRVELSLFGKINHAPDAAPTGTVHYEIRVEALGSPEKVVFNSARASKGAAAFDEVYYYRIDLAEFGGKTVNLTFETKGRSAGAGWGRARIYAYR